MARAKKAPQYNSGGLTPGESVIYLLWPPVSSSSIKVRSVPSGLGLSESTVGRDDASSGISHYPEQVCGRASRRNRQRAVEAAEPS